MASLPAILPAQASTLTDPRTARLWTDQLLSYYPQTTPVDVTFLEAIAEILASYPEKVVSKICNRTCGLPVRTQFLPTLKEIKDACEEEMRAVYDKTRSDRLAAEQFRLRDEVATMERERAEGKRATYEQLIAKLPPELRMKRPTDKFMPDWVPTIEELCKKYGFVNPYENEKNSEENSDEEKNPFEDL